jgi:hypothetical protein
VFDVVDLYHKIDEIRQEKIMQDRQEKEHFQEVKIILSKDITMNYLEV